MTKTNKIVTAVAVLLVIVLCGGLLTVLFVHKDKTDVKPAEIQYNATFGEKFEEEHPVSTLSRMDNMPLHRMPIRIRNCFPANVLPKSPHR